MDRDENMTTEAAAVTPLQPAATMLAAYLDRPDLPDQVEMRCLQAADELQRAGGYSDPTRPAGQPVTLDQVHDALLELPAAIFETDLVLEALADLNAAADALRAG